MQGATTERGRSWLEERRLRAWDLKLKDWPQRLIAEALGVTEGAVSQWIKRAREQGVEALRSRKRGGSQPQLGLEQRTQLLELLAQGAEAFGFEGNVWTLPRVAELIHRQFGIRHHPAHVSKILRRCGWSPQKPMVRAAERNEQAIAQWKQEHGPELKKAPKQGYTTAFLDEAGFRLLPTLVRTWAPRGKTPIVRPRVRRRHVSALSALTLDGKLYFGLQDHAYNSKSVVGFLRRLLRRIRGKLLLLWDGSNIHGGPPVRKFLASPEGARIRTVRLPGYAPELNPTELVWGQLKHVEMKNVCCDTLAELRATVQRAVRRLRRKVHLLLAFVQHARPP